MDWDKIATDRDQALVLTALLRSNADLRDALILAGKEIVKLNFGKKDAPVLEKLRSTLREARSVEKRARGRL